MSTVHLTRRSTRIIKASEIQQNYSMKNAIDAMERAFTLLSSGDSFVPLRNVSKLPSNELLMLFKPAYVEKDRKVAIKFLTQRENSCIMGIPVIQGIVLVLDSVTGEILSIMDGEYITALRTGAASGLATRYFAAANAQTVALFGCGAQGKTQLEAVACERNIKKVFVFDKSSKRAANFIKEMEISLNLEMVYSKDTSVLKGAEIICTATNSTKPLFRREEVKNGTHINAIGSFQPHMQELDPLLIKAAKVYVDQAEPCLKESGDFIRAKEQGIIGDNHIIGELGDFCLNKIQGRETEAEITLFKSVGVAIQDYAVATDIYNSSLAKDFGMQINFFE